MKKLLLFPLLAIVFSQGASAKETDLVLAGEKWQANFAKYVCNSTGKEVSAPKAFQAMNVVFEKLTTDATLDNGLIKATFVEDGVSCRYNALMLADNTAKTIRLVESKAFTAARKYRATCTEGKALLDAALESNEYLYFGHPHNLAIMIPLERTEKTCAGSKFIGIDFIVSGRVKK